MRHIAYLASLGCALSLAVDGCGTKVLCGDGTVQVDNECVAVAPPPPEDTGSPIPVEDAGQQVVVDVSVAADTGSKDTGVDVSSQVEPTVDASIVYRPSFAGLASVAPASTTSLMLSWMPALDPLTPQSQLVYRVYMATAAGKEDFAAPKQVTPAGASSTLVTGLTAGTDYFFVVRAVNQTMLEDTNSKEQHAKPDTDDVPPNFDGTLTATTQGAASIKLEWAPATDDKTPAAGLVYAAYWATTPSDVRSGAFGGVAEPGATSLVVSNLPKATTSYFFRVEARDASGNSTSNPHPVSAKTLQDNTAPQFGGCVQTLAPSAGGVNLAWSPAKDDSTSGSAITYNVYASTTPLDGAGGGFDFTKPTAVFKNGVLTGRVGGLVKETQYYFVCRAVDQDGNEDTNTVQVSAITGKDSASPSFGGVTSATLKGNTATLTWMPATDDQTPAEAIRYLVFQGNAPDGEDTATPVAQAAVGATSITITKLAAGTIYYWIVRAADEAGNVDSNHVERGVQTPNVVCFDNDIQPILTKNCAVVGCHTGPASPQGLDMSVGFAYDNLVGVGAVEDQPPTADGGGFDNDGGPHVYLRRKRIKAPDPNQPPPDSLFANESYLYLKVTSDPDIVGSPMPPPPRPALEGKDVGTIRNWILQGALRKCN